MKRVIYIHGFDPEAKALELFNELSYQAKLAARLVEMGHIPYMSAAASFIAANSDTKPSKYRELNEHFLMECDSILFKPGKELEEDPEINLAKDLGKELFTSIADIEIIEKLGGEDAEYAEEGETD